MSESPSRRAFLSGLIAAPVIIPYARLMKVSPIVISKPKNRLLTINEFNQDMVKFWRNANEFYLNIAPQWEDQEFLKDTQW